MSIVSLSKVSKDFGIKPLFTELTFVAHEGQKIALIGANGSGKSTLLKLISGFETPDSGDVTVNGNVTVSYVVQRDILNSECSIKENLLEILRERNLEGIVADHEIERALSETGFADFSVKISTLSGGWRKRLQILSGVLGNPSLLLLDEPTNHLDVPGILWLEDIIQNFRGTVIFVSHDRYFIERIADRTIELDKRFPGGFLDSEGGFSASLEKKQTFLEQMQSYKASLSNKVRREIDWLRAGVQARATKAKSRIDEAHRMISELNSLELANEAAELGFAATKRKTKELIKAVEISKSYSKLLFSNVSTTLYPGSRIGVVGANGSGKTTLLKVLLSEETPDKGKILRASNLSVSYFGQMRQQINLDLTLKKTLCPHGDAVVFEGREIHIVTWGKRFLFSKDDLDRPMRDLSGGEQARALLALLSLSASDVLVFDEPTNDLDISTLEVLEKSLIQFPGAMLLVTHDRYLLDRVCTGIIGLLGNGRAENFADYTQFEIAFSDQRIIEKKSKATPKKETNISFQDKKELQSIERKIETLEKKISEREEQMHSEENAFDIKKLTELSSEIKKLKNEHESLFERWAQLSQ